MRRHPGWAISSAQARAIAAAYGLAARISGDLDDDDFDPQKEPPEFGEMDRAAERLGTMRDHDARAKCR